MKNVSNEFTRTMAERTDFYLEASVKFSDGAELELEKSSFYVTGNGYTDAAGSSSFPIGAAIEKQIEIYLINDEDQYYNYNFIGAEFTIYCCLDLDSGATERILLGTFTVTEPETYGTIITVIAVDGMYRGDVDYSTTMTFPLSIGEAIRDSCATCGVTLIDTTFENDDYIISAAPEGITHRSFWGMCAMLAGGNARMDEYNRLHISSYNFSLFDRIGLNGGIFDSSTPYSTGDTADGGTFSPWNTGDTVDGGTFSEMKDYHVFWRSKNLSVATDDVVITGIQTVVGEETYLYGSEGYILSITNNLIAGSPQDAVNRIGALVVGARFRPFELDHPAYPVADMGDICFLIDRKQNTYQSIITDINFLFYGYTTIRCQADNPIRNSSRYNSQLTQAIVQSRLNTQKQITEYDKAVQMLTSLITQSFGVFKTEEVLDDGSMVYYMHNKPTLEESQTIWRMTADAFAVSTNGGQTWNAGMDSSGNAILNVLSTIGINFSWARGGTITLGGSGNGNGRLVILNASGTQVGYIDNTGVHFNQGSFAGILSAATGTFSGNLQAAGGTFSGQIFASEITGTSMETMNAAESEKIIISGGSQEYRRKADNYTEFVRVGAIYPGISSNVLVGSSYMDINSLIFEVENCLSMRTVSGQKIFDATSYEYGGWKTENIRFYVDGYFDYIETDEIYASKYTGDIITTSSYGNVLASSYSTASAELGDSGSASTDNDGICYVAIDDYFSEIANTEINYYVFLQKEGDGDIWVDEKTPNYFVVKGTPNISFSWEIKAYKKGYEYQYLSDAELKQTPINENELESILSMELEQYEEELEATLNEDLESFSGN